MTHQSDGILNMKHRKPRSGAIRYVQVGLKISLGKRLQLQELAIKQNISMTEVIERALDIYEANLSKKEELA